MLFTGCEKLPKCSDDEVISLLKQRMIEAVESETGKNADGAIKLKVKNIKTISHDKANQSYTCKASVYVSLKGSVADEDDALTMSYKVERLDGGEFDVSIIRKK